LLWRHRWQLCSRRVPSRGSGRGHVWVGSWSFPDLVLSALRKMHSRYGAACNPLSRLTAIGTHVIWGLLHCGEGPSAGSSDRPKAFAHRTRQLAQNASGTAAVLQRLLTARRRVDVACIQRLSLRNGTIGACPIPSSRITEYCSAC
jgi:hypothetical protein